MKQSPVLLAAIAVMAPLVSVAQIYPPKPGVEMPQAYFDRMEQDRTAFQFQNAWLKKVEGIREAREKYLAERGFYDRGLVAPGLRSQLSVTGTVQVPVFCVKFSNTGADPYPTSTLDTKLFSGPFAPQTLTQYYTEISYGDLNMTGQVFGWHTLPNVDTYYEGGCNGLCGTAQIGSLIINTLAANDGTIDFGQYDNDGPDGVPNSGDDDGVADFVAFVHPEAGGECGNSNIWSHRWVLTGWTGGVPYTTNDPRTGGGFILVNDYVIQPAYNCVSLGGGVIDIGVFCHEFGHALSLPDLYDTDGGSEGIGDWGLMGSGSWHTTTQPSHMCAWSKRELGWATETVVEGKKQTYSLPNVEQNRNIYRLDVMDERWRRMTPCAISGSYSMRCGLTAAEGNARNWVDQDGYGDMWKEAVHRDFSYDGTAGVTLDYDYSYDSETLYDYTYVRVDVNGTVSTVTSYDGTGSGHQNIDLTPYLFGSGASTYRISFEFESDIAWSDRDGFNPTNCGPFVFDNVSVVGGGESYFTDFETREDGWCHDMTNPPEHFLVENRQPVGSDVALYSGGGIAIWHVNQDVTRTRQAGNTGGSSGLLPHGVSLEQADNADHLGAGLNRGDAGDPFPGSTNNTTFDNFSGPWSRGENGTQNNACVINISANPANGGNMSADMAGGWPLPTLTSLSPTTAPAGVVVTVQINGTLFACGATSQLIMGVNVIDATQCVWLGKDRMLCDFDLDGAAPGVYDLAIINPGNSCTIVPTQFTVDAPVPTALQAYEGRQVGDNVELTWRVSDAADVIGWKVYRRAGEDAPYVDLTAPALPGDARRFVDEQVVRGQVSTYRLVWITEGGEGVAGDVRVKTRALEFALRANYPNPFNPRTTVPFELAKPTFTTLTIYDIRGAVVRTLVSDHLAADRYVVEWDGRNDAGETVGSGVYFYKLVAGSFQDVRKLLLVK